MSQFATLTVLSLSLIISGCGPGFKNRIFGQSVQQSLSAQSLEQVGDMIIGSNMIYKDRGGRFFINSASENATRTWPGNVVPLNFDVSFSQAERDNILAACNEWSNVANVRCVIWSGTGSYLRIRSDLNGCSSTVGYYGNFVDRVNLQAGNTLCQNYGTRIHEFGHALGLVHEHQHPNRDTYLYVHADSPATESERSYQVNFASTAGRTNSPYDYRSIMHYQVTDNGSTGADSYYYFGVLNDQGQQVGRAFIDARDNIPIADLDNIGQRTALSTGDADGMRALYPITPPTIQRYTLRIHIRGNGQGSVNFNTFVTAGIDTERTFDGGTVVSLTGVPANTNSRFVAFSNHADCADGSVTMNSDISCDAEFAAILPPLCDGHAEGDTWLDTSGRRRTTGEACPQPLAGTQTRIDQINQQKRCTGGVIVNNSSIATTFSFLFYEDITCHTPRSCTTSSGTHDNGTTWSEVTVTSATGQMCPTGEIGTRTAVTTVTQPSRCDDGTVANTSMASTVVTYVDVTCRTPLACTTPSGTHASGTTWNEVTVTRATGQMCPTGQTGTRTAVTTVTQPSRCDDGTVANTATSTSAITYENVTCVAPALSCTTPSGTHANGTTWSEVTVTRATGQMCPTGQTGTRTAVTTVTQPSRCDNGVVSNTASSTSAITYEDVTCQTPALACGTHASGTTWNEVTVTRATGQMCPTGQTGTRTAVTTVTQPSRCDNGVVSNTATSTSAITYEDVTCQTPALACGAHASGTTWDEVTVTRATGQMCPAPQTGTRTAVTTTTQLSSCTNGVVSPVGSPTVATTYEDVTCALPTYAYVVDFTGFVGTFSFQFYNTPGATCRRFQNGVETTSTTYNRAECVVSHGARLTVSVTSAADYTAPTFTGPFTITSQNGAALALEASNISADTTLSIANTVIRQRFHFARNISAGGTASMERTYGGVSLQTWPDIFAAIGGGNAGLVEVKQNSVMNLTALPATGYAFQRWDCTTGQFSTPSISVTMNAEITCTAQFAPVNQSVTIARSGAGEGSISVNGQICTTLNCSFTIAYGTAVTIDVVKPNGNYFVQNTCPGTVTLTGNISCAVQIEPGAFHFADHEDGGGLGQNIYYRLMNSSNAALTVQVLAHHPSGGVALDTNITIAAHSDRQLNFPADFSVSGKFGVTFNSNEPGLSASRSNVQAVSATMAHATIGAKLPKNSLFFPAMRAGYSNYIIVYNPGGTSANVQVLDQRTNAFMPTVTLAPRGSTTFAMPNAAENYGVALLSSAPVVAEHSVFNSGGAANVSASSGTNKLYFAEAFTNSALNTAAIYLASTSPLQAYVRVTYHQDNGSLSANDVSVSYGVSTVIPMPANFSGSVELTSLNGNSFSANMYSHLAGGAMEASEGTTVLANTWDFADGMRNENSISYISVLNPNASAAFVTITTRDTAGVERATLVPVPANGRVGVDVGNDTGATGGFGVSLTSDQPVTAEMVYYLGFSGGNIGTGRLLKMPGVPR